MNYDTLGEAWVGTIQNILDEGKKEFDGEVVLYEICNINISINSISEYDRIIEKYADKNRINLMKKKYNSLEIVHPFDISYGQTIYNNNGVNQVEYIIKKLKKKIETKSATISTHFPGEKKPTCLSLIDCKIRDNKLNFTAVYRSQNIIGSQPGNIIALKEIQNYIAKELNVEVGNMNIYVISAHIYEKDIKEAKNIVSEVKNEKN